MVTAQRGVVELATITAEFIVAFCAPVALCDYFIPTLLAVWSWTI